VLRGRDCEGLDGGFVSVYWIMEGGMQGVWRIGRRNHDWLEVVVWNIQLNDW